MTLSRKLFLCAYAVNALGNGLFVTISAIYFTRFGGLPVALLGLGLVLAAASGLVCGPWLGHLADRLNPILVYVGLLLAQAILAFLYAACHGSVPLIILLCTAAAAGRGAAAARTASVGRVVPRAERVAFRSLGRALSNGGAAVGAGAGALVLVAGTQSAFRWAIIINAATYATAAATVFQVKVPPPVPESVTPDSPASDSATSAGKIGPASERPAKRRPPALRDGRFLSVTGLNAILLLHDSMISVGIPLWITRRTDAPVWMVSAVVVLNTVGVLLLQVPLTRKVDSVASACTAARRAGGCLAIACLALALTSGRGGVLAVTLIVLTALLHLGGEMLQAAAAWTYSMDLAPEDALGQYQGVFNAGLDVTMLIAPAIYSWIVLAPGGWGWLALTGVFTACALAFAPVTAWAGRSSRQEAPA
jgi:MFS family permease